MKRLAFCAFILLLLGSAFTSCEKCTVCTAQTLGGDVVSEWCGNELDVRDFEQYFIDSLADIEIPGYCERGPNYGK
ncbi:MAG: hypothetical protein ACHQFW_01225 [Chitinophagales bacterium]